MRVLPSRMEGRLRVFVTANELYESLYRRISNLAAVAIQDRSEFRIVLTGGRTVEPLYRRLRHLETNWDRWRVFLSDERCVPADDDMRISKMVLDAWLAHVPVSMANLSTIPAELGPRQAAERYEDALSSVGTFDLVLLSVGEDGHVASIFPNSLEYCMATPRAVLPITNAPKEPRCRVTLSMQRLADSRNVILLGGGIGKRAAARDFLAGVAGQPAAQMALRVPVDFWLDGDASPNPADWLPPN